MDTKATALLDKIYKLVIRGSTAIVVPNVPEERLRIEILQSGEELSDLLEEHGYNGDLDDFEIDEEKLGAIAKHGSPQISAKVFGVLVDNIIGEPIYFSLMKSKDVSRLLFKRHAKYKDLLTVVDEDTGMEFEVDLTILLQDIAKSGSYTLLEPLLSSGILTKDETRKVFKMMTLQPKV